LGKIDTVDEDKPLQLNLFETRNKIYYLEGALIYDEKVSTSAAFQNQRRRWLSSQFYYFKKFFVKGFRLLLKGNIDYFNHAIIHNIFPPRALLLLSLVVFSILFTAIPPHDGLRWWILFLVYILALGVALPLKFLSKDFFKAVSHLPFALFRMVQALLGVKKTQENIHTEHTEISIDNPLFKNNDGE
jgi:cellulose synthase/poly-beta-1,6-N-acetylglucosamine synthase-like glycosyltransferase